MRKIVIINIIELRFSTSGTHNECHFLKVSTNLLHNAASLRQWTCKFITITNLIISEWERKRQAGKFRTSVRQLMRKCENNEAWQYLSYFFLIYTALSKQQKKMWIRNEKQGKVFKLWGQKREIVKVENWNDFFLFFEALSEWWWRSFSLIKYRLFCSMKIKVAHCKMEKNYKLSLVFNFAR
jgi:hypothetical protein